MTHIALLSGLVGIPTLVGVQKTTVQLSQLSHRWGSLRILHFNLPTSRSLLKCRCTKGFRTGDVSLTPPVEVPSYPPLGGSDYSLRYNAMVVASCGFLRGGMKGGQKGGGTGGVKGGVRSVNYL